MRVAIYVRVSTDEQASSAEAQESGARAWADTQGHVVVMVYRDVGHSGAEWVRRPGILDLQLDVTREPRPWDAVVVRDLDRFGRDQARLAMMLATIAEHDAQVVEWSTGRIPELDVMGRMMLGLKAGMAELERELIARRTRVALRQKAERGLNVGGIAFGYAHRRDDDGVRDVILEPEAEVVREVFARAAAGESVRAIARSLNDRGVPSPRAGRRGTGSWSPSALLEIVRNPRYRGRIVWGEVGAHYKGGTRKTVERTDVVERDDPSLAIVDPSLWQRAQADSDASRKAQGRPVFRGREPKHLLIGLGACDHCGGPLGSARQLSGGVSVPAYCCLWHRDRGASVCPAGYCRVASRLDAVAVDFLVREVLDDDLIAGALSDARRLALAAEPDPRLEALQAQEREHATAVARLSSAIEQGAGELAGLVGRLAARERQLAEVRAELSRAAGSAAVVPVDLEVRMRTLAADARVGLLADPAKTRAVMLAVRARFRVSQPVPRGPVWLLGEALPGALLASLEQGTHTGFDGDPNGTRAYPVGPIVRLHRQVA